MITRLQRRFAAVLLLAFAAVCPAVLANPSSKDFDAALDVHGKQFSRELQRKAQELYETANESILAFAEQIKSNRPQRISGKEIGQTYVRINQMFRLGTELKTLGETAGLDYDLRYQSLKQTLDQIADIYKGLPTSQKTIQGVRLGLQRRQPARMKQLEKLQNLAQEGKWETAEVELYEVYDDTQVGASLLSNREQGQIFAPFSEVYSAITAAMHRIRREKARELIAARRREEMPDFAAVLAEVNAAAAALANAEQAPLAGELLSGPQLVTRLGQRWTEVQAAVIRCRTLDRLAAGTSAMGIPGDMQPGAAANDQLATAYRQFSSEMARALATAIEGDASRVSGQHAVDLYVQYLPAITPLVRRSNGSLTATVSGPLNRLAARADQFPQEIAAYNEATSDLLRWRARVARARAEKYEVDFTPIPKAFVEGTQSSPAGGGEPAYMGLFPLQNASAGDAALMASVPQVMPTAIKRLQGRNVASTVLTRVAPSARTAISRYQDRTYVTVPAPLDAAGEIDALKYDLLISENAPPVTLLASAAITTAENGEFDAVGGEVQDLYLESVATRFASLPPAATVLIPLDELADERQGPDFLSQVLMRFHLSPRWARHAYFFTEFSPPALSPPVSE